MSVSEGNGVNAPAIGVMPITQSIQVRLKQQQWTDRPRGLIEIEVGVSVAPDPLYNTAENLDRVQRLLRSRLQAYMAEALSPDGRPRPS